jgi:sugar phosphate isomerase/epimerase
VTLSRRDFLAISGAAGLSAALPDPRALLRPDKLKRIGIQLYTVRQALDTEFAGTLERLAAIGYQEVEFAWNRGASPAETKEILRATGLTAPAAHLSVDDFESGWAATLSTTRSLGIEYPVLAWIDAEQRKSLADYHQWAERFNRYGKAAREAGLSFAYHNHAAELTPIDGTIPYDILLGETDPDLVTFEMDVYWVLEGGGNPLSYFARWPGRFPLLHVKGRAADGAMVDVGAGAVDWSAVFARSKQAGVRHSFVEHDDAPDPFASAAASYSYLRRLRYHDA